MAYTKCDANRGGDHSFTGIDNRCMFCDRKPWYRSARTDDDPLTSEQSRAVLTFMSTPLSAYNCVSCLDLGFISHGFDSVDACLCAAGVAFRSTEVIYLDYITALADDRDNYARPA